jgi:toxin-antitoxin system PIN domain toxin
MIAVDTNLLVYAHRRDSDWHVPAAQALRGLAEGRAQWAIPWPCIHEFVAITTHPRIYSPPSKLEEALAQVRAWLSSPSVVLLSEGPEHVDAFEGAVMSGKAAGPRVHDAKIAALCAEHGISELWTADRDFGRFPAIRAHNPLKTV